MTVSSEQNRAGPYLCNGATVAFDYVWRVLDESHLQVILTTPAGEQTLALGADYTVSGVGNAGGGQILTTTAYLAPNRLTVIPDVPFTQEVDLENQGAYNAETIEAALDLSVMRDQQLNERLGRAVTIPPSADPEALDALIEDIVRLGDSADEVDTVANNVGSVLTVAGNIGAVNTVAGIAGDVEKVATIDDAVVGVATIDTEVLNLDAIRPEIVNVSAVRSAVSRVSNIRDAVVAVDANAAAISGVFAGIDDVQTVADLDAAISALASRTAAIDTVAGIAPEVEIVGQNVADVKNFADVYYGSSATPPTTRRSGMPLQEGDIYNNTTLDALFFWQNGQWAGLAAVATPQPGSVSATSFAPALGAFFKTRALAAAAIIPAAMGAIITGGYAADGDGGGTQYVRRGTDLPFGPQLNTNSNFSTQDGWSYSSGKSEPKREHRISCANRTEFPISVTPRVAGAEFAVSKVAFWNGRKAVKKIEITYVNWYLDGTGREAVGTHPLTVQCILELENGTLVVAECEGKEEITIPAGESRTFTANVTSGSSPDGTASVITANAKYFVRTFTRGAIGEAEPRFHSIDNTGKAEGGQFTSVEATALANFRGTVPVSNTNTMYGPSLITGVTVDGKPEPCVLVAGDSISMGSAENGRFGDARGNRGYINRGLDADRRHFIKGGRSGARCEGFYDFNFARRMALMRGIVTHIICQVGENDTGTTFAAIQGRLSRAHGDLYTMFGAPVFQCKLGPKSASTDGWTTLANQTPDNLQYRDDLAAWFDSLVGTTLRGTINPFDVWSAPAPDRGKWKVPGYTTDGLHPEASAHEEAKAVIQAATAAGWFDNPSIVSGELRAARYDGIVGQPRLLTPGTVWRVTYTVRNYVRGDHQGGLFGGVEQGATIRTGNGTFTDTFVAGDGNAGAGVRLRNFEGRIDNVTLEQAAPGRFQSADGAWWTPDAARISVKAFGAKGDRVTNDFAAMQEALDWAKNSSGGRISVPAGYYQIDGNLNADNCGGVAFDAEGGSGSGLNGVTINFRANNGKPGFLLSNSSGFSARGIVFRGVETPLSAIFKTDNTSYLCFFDCQFVGGESGLWLFNGQTTRMFHCRITVAVGRAGVLLNGEGDEGQSNGLEAYGCVFSAERNSKADCVRIDGSGGSSKFIGCGFLFGYHGVVFDNSFGGSAPGYLYIIGGGFENCQGSPVRVASGKKVMLGMFYASSDGDSPGVDIGENVLDVTCTGLYVDGNGGDGIRSAGRNVVVSGCDIVKNGRKGLDASNLRNITGIVAGTNGKIRITYSNPVITSGQTPIRKDDVAIVTGVVGTTEANGEWLVDYVSDTVVELRGSTFTNAYVSGGKLGRQHSGIYVTPTGQLTASGNRIGHRIGNEVGPEGGNNQRYGIRVEGDRRCHITDNECGDNVIDAILNNNTNPNSRIAGNSGGQRRVSDGQIVMRVAGALTNTNYVNLAALFGRRIRVTGIAAVLGAGTANVRIRADATTLSPVIAATTTLQMLTTGTSFDTALPVIDGRTAPVALGVNISGATGASDVLLVVSYQDWD